MLTDHPKFITALESSSRESETAPSLNGSALCIDGGEAVTQKMKEKRPIGRRKAKSVESQKDLIKENLKFTEEAVAAQRNYNEILQAQYEMGTFTYKEDE